MAACAFEDSGELRSILIQDSKNVDEQAMGADAKLRADVDWMNSLNTVNCPNTMDVEEVLSGLPAGAAEKFTLQSVLHMGSGVWTDRIELK
jgi:hypothetical protein